MSPEPLAIQTIQINILAMPFNYIFGFIHRELAWDQLWQGASVGEAAWAQQARDARTGSSGESSPTT